MAEAKIISEAKIIERTEYPLTAQALAEKLRECGLGPGQTVLVHLAMSQLGWVVGGAEAVIMALLEVLGQEGTLMMPTQTGNNTDPAEWQYPPVPQSWWQVIRDHTPAPLDGGRAGAISYLAWHNSQCASGYVIRGSGAPG
jgi:aminoglycoside 3-N-acetyltransferase